MTLARFSFTSISSRLLFASALLLPLFLGLTGFFLDRAFNNSLQAAEHARLRGHINLLFSVAELPEATNPKRNSLRMPITLIEADFERPNSGLYAYIYNDKHELVWHSNSAALTDAPSYASVSLRNRPGKMVIDQLTLDDEAYFVGHYDVLWEDAKGKPHPFRFVVVHSGSDYRTALKAYRKELWRWLGAAGIFLLIAQTAILRWGLNPLGKLAIALKAMQSGNTSNIAGEHPRELQEVVDNLNQVLAREQSLRQRYRNSLTDLAHSLKTPLAVLQSNLNVQDDELRKVTREQVARMNQVVTYQLQRAVSSQQSGTTRRTRLEPIVQRLLGALQKVYAHKHITHLTHLDAHIIATGDEQDLMELLGNLLENAFKYSHSRVELTGVDDGESLILTLDDDGPGVPLEERERILERGQRLDTSIPGQGIGLAVAAEIVHSYQGTIGIYDSPLGGAQFRITLPQPKVK